MRSKKSARRLANKKCDSHACLEFLERRQLFSAQLNVVLSPLLATPAQPQTVDLSAHFSDPNIPGTVAELQTSQGKIDIALTDTQTPITVANFLHYINSGEFNQTIFSRSVVGFVEQLGGYNINNLPTHIPVASAIQSEFSAARSNVRGTVAMALSGKTNNTAQSEWFFNLADNSSNLDKQNGGFTVFGHVIGNGMNIVDRIAKFPIKDISKSTGNSALTTVPLQNYPSAHNPPIRLSNLVTVNQAIAIPGIVYTAVSDNASVVKPLINGSQLSFSFASGAKGSANITVTARSFDGTIATNTFLVTVPDSSTPAAGPVAGADGPVTVVAGLTKILQPLLNDTDSSAALNTSSLAVTTAPAHGTISINQNTGEIHYTPAAGYTGPDSLQYTIADTLGQASAPATLTINVVAAPVTVTIGTNTARSLTYTEPDGTVSHLTLDGGTAVITFASSDVTVTTTGGVATAHGAGATIDSIVITNTPKFQAKLEISAVGGSDQASTIGSITDAGAMIAIKAPHTVLTGSLNVDGLSTLTLASAVHATLNISGSRPSLAMDIANASDTSVTSAEPIIRIRSAQWLNTDGITDLISAPSIRILSVSGNFAESLNLTDTNTSIESARIGGSLVGGSWNIFGNTLAVSAKSAASTWSFSTGAAVDSIRIASGDVGSTLAVGHLGSLRVAGNLTGGTLTAQGSIDSISAHSAAAAWSLSAKTAVGSLHFTGDLAGNITAGSITALTVGGSLHDNTIKTQNAFVAGVEQIHRLSVGGAINNTSILSAGNVGIVSGASLTNSHLYAGVSTAITNGGTLPTAASDFVSAAEIKDVRLGAAKPAFSNTFIAADTIRSLGLGLIKTDNAAHPDGVAGKTLLKLTGTLDSGPRLNLHQGDLITAGTLSSFLTRKGITSAKLNNFNISVLI